MKLASVVTTTVCTLVFLTIGASCYAMSLSNHPNSDVLNTVGIVSFILMSMFCVFATVLYYVFYGQCSRVATV